jgi:hypothetical protein
MDTLSQLLPWLEMRNPLHRHLHNFPGPWISCLVRRFAAQIERSKAADFDSIRRRECLSHELDNRLHGKTSIQRRES